MATATTETFRRLHREVYESYQVQIDAISNEAREATSPIISQRNAELLEEDKRHNQVCCEIYKRIDETLKPLSKPFEDRIGLVIADRDAALKALKAEHGVD